MKKPIFWVVIIILLAIILFVYMRHKPAVTTNPNSQTSALLVPAKTVAVTNNDTAANTDANSANTANPAANTPAQEAQTLNPNNNNAANVNDNDTIVTNLAVNTGRANENTGNTTDQTSSD